MPQAVRNLCNSLIPHFKRVSALGGATRTSRTKQDRAPQANTSSKHTPSKQALPKSQKHLGCKWSQELLWHLRSPKPGLQCSSKPEHPQTGRVKGSQAPPLLCSPKPQGRWSPGTAAQTQCKELGTQVPVPALENGFSEQLSGFPERANLKNLKC